MSLDKDSNKINVSLKQNTKNTQQAPINNSLKRQDRQDDTNLKSLTPESRKVEAATKNKINSING